MELKNISKTENLNYPTLSAVPNNNFMKKVPQFSMLLSSMLATNTLAVGFSEQPLTSAQIGIVGGIRVSYWYLAYPYIAHITLIISLIMTIINSKKYHKLKKTSVINNENTTNSELDKLKRKLELWLFVLLIAVCMLTFPFISMYIS